VNDHHPIHLSAPLRANIKLANTPIGFFFFLHDAMGIDDEVLQEKKWV
jgi:hypothetical protein